ncbi:hypothetical protein VTO73DRAFT_13196 [Trametes versicolor]
MSSLSAMNHVGPSSSNTQVGTDPNVNHAHSPTMQLMSQPPANHTVQSDPNAGPYVSVHRFRLSAGPDGYTHHHVMPFVQGPPPPGGELMYAEDPSSAQEAGVPEEEEEGSPPSSAMNGGADIFGKRKQPDSGMSEGSLRKRRQRVPNGGDLDGDGDMHDLDVGPNGGPKHWTEGEKTKFFTWMLTSDDHWDAFRTRMNTVFRECSSELFPGRKSYTALKSCFHRNLEVFKQVHAFQMFSANHFRQMQAENPNAQQPSVDSVLDAARVAGLNVGTLNVKVIDRWYETGWYELFRKRYREDPKTGLPVPFYGPTEPSEASSSTAPPVHPMMGLNAHANIDPHILAQTAPPHGTENGASTQAASPEPLQLPTPLQTDSYGYSSSLPQPSEYRPLGPSASFPPPSSTYLRSSQSSAPRASLPPAPAQSPARSHTVEFSRTPSDIPRPMPHPEHNPQVAQAFNQLSAVTGSLLGVCSSLKELIQQQAEESRARTELMRAEAAQRLQHTGSSDDKEKGAEISMEKVTFATEILKNGPDNEDIKRAAIECLTKYLTRGL